MDHETMQWMRWMPWLAFVKDFLMICVVFSLIVKVSRLRKQVDQLQPKDVKREDSECTTP